MITKELEIELREWMRPVSPLTAFAKSLRNEGEGAAPVKDASKEANDDPFADLDLDELPTDVKEKITNAQKVLADTKKSATELTTKQQQTEAFARLQQSRADKLEGVVKSHNLPIDGQKPQVDQQDAEFQQLVDQFQKDGLKPEAAQAYAKMFQSAGQMQEQKILARLGPLVGSVGSLQADQVLSSAKGNYQQVFSIPELSQQIHQNVQSMVSAGNPVTKDTVEHLVSMAWGQHVLKNPDAMKTTATQTGIPQFGNNSLSMGGLPNNPQQTQNDGRPQVTQPETVSIVNALNAEMMRGLPKKK